MYYFHDKREEGETTRLSDERVEWTETRGLFTKDADMAWRVMAATAMDSDRLKREASIKATGRQSDQCVYAYSIGWHPDEAAGLSKPEMIRAADESLRALGAEGYQAIFVAHNDTPHPHVHVILNRTSPEDGRLLKIRKDYLTLSKWAQSYEEERGHVWCKERVANNALRKDGTFAKYEGAQSREHQQMEQAAKKAGVPEDAIVRERRNQEMLDSYLVEDTKTDELKARQALPDHLKAKLGDRLNMKVRHKVEFADLDARYADKKEELYERATDMIETVSAKIEKQFRPDRDALARKQYSERQEFDGRESSIIGKIQNVGEAIASRKVSELDPDDKGWTAAAFNFLTSKEARKDAIGKRHYTERRALDREEQQAKQSSKSSILSDLVSLIKSAADVFLVERKALTTRHDSETKQYKAAWTHRDEERRLAFDTLARRSRSKGMVDDDLEQSRDRAAEHKAREEYREAVARGERPKRTRKRRKGRSRNVTDE